MKYLGIGTLTVALITLLALTQISSAQVSGIDGTWYFGEKPLTVQIYDSGWRFNVTNAEGDKSHGKAFNDSVIYLPAENISGQIEFDATIIEWSDGTYWSREAFTGDTPPNIPQD